MMHSKVYFLFTVGMISVLSSWGFALEPSQIEIQYTRRMYSPQTQDLSAGFKNYSISNLEQEHTSDLEVIQDEKKSKGLRKSWSLFEILKINTNAFSQYLNSYSKNNGLDKKISIQSLTLELQDSDSETAKEENFYVLVVSFTDANQNTYKYEFDERKKQSEWNNFKKTPAQFYIASLNMLGVALAQLQEEL